MDLDFLPENSSSLPSSVSSPKSGFLLLQSSEHFGSDENLLTETLFWFSEVLSHLDIEQSFFERILGKLKRILEKLDSLAKSSIEFGLMVSILSDFSVFLALGLPRHSEKLISFQNSLESSQALALFLESVQCSLGPIDASGEAFVPFSSSADGLFGTKGSGFLKRNNGSKDQITKKTFFTLSFSISVIILKSGSNTSKLPSFSQENKVLEALLTILPQMKFPQVLEIAKSLSKLVETHSSFFESQNGLGDFLNSKTMQIESLQPKSTSELLKMDQEAEENKLYELHEPKSQKEKVELQTKKAACDFRLLFQSTPVDLFLVFISEASEYFQGVFSEEFIRIPSSNSSKMVLEEENKWDETIFEISTIEEIVLRAIGSNKQKAKDTAFNLFPSDLCKLRNLIVTIKGSLPIGLVLLAKAHENFKMIRGEFLDLLCRLIFTQKPTTITSFVLSMPFKMRLALCDWLSPLFEYSSFFPKPAEKQSKAMGFEEERQPSIIASGSFSDFVSFALNGTLDWPVSRIIGWIEHQSTLDYPEENTIFFMGLQEVFLKCLSVASKEERQCYLLFEVTSPFSSTTRRIGALQRNQRSFFLHRLVDNIGKCRRQTAMKVINRFFMVDASLLRFYLLQVKIQKLHCVDWLGSTLSLKHRKPQKKMKAFWLMKFLACTWRWIAWRK